jgi:hypothetical protein
MVSLVVVDDITRSLCLQYRLLQLSGVDQVAKARIRRHLHSGHAAVYEVFMKLLMEGLVRYNAAQQQRSKTMSSI